MARSRNLRQTDAYSWPPGDRGFGTTNKLQAASFQDLLTQQTAGLLGISRKTLWEKMKRLKMGTIEADLSQQRSSGENAGALEAVLSSRQVMSPATTSAWAMAARVIYEHYGVA